MKLFGKERSEEKEEKREAPYYLSMLIFTIAYCMVL